MTNQLDLFSNAPDAPSTPFVFARPAPAPAKAAATVQAWIKTYQGPGRIFGEIDPNPPAPIPTLNHIGADCHAYRAATFALAPGVSVQDYPGGFSQGVNVPGSKELISLFDAVRRGVAWETV